MRNDFITQNQKAKAKLRGIIVISVFLAFAINILVCGICELFTGDSVVCWFFIAIGVLIISAIWIIYLILQKKNAVNSVCLKGFLITHQDRIVSVSEYGISEDMERNLSSAFSEKKALAKQWKDAEKISPYKGSAKKDLIVELIQYCIIDRLSMCLTDYFNKDYEKKAKIKNYEEKDIPEVLLSNRFLKLFTEPMEDREAFMGSDTLCAKSNKGQGTVIRAMRPNGALYNKLKLTLPENTIITMPNKQAIRLETDYIVLEFVVDFDGFNVFIDPDFHKYYLNLVIDLQNDETIDYTFAVNITTKIKHPLLIGKKQSFFYEWIDLFLEEMEQYISSESFYKKINWNGLQAQIRVLKNGFQKRDDCQ